MTITREKKNEIESDTEEEKARIDNLWTNFLNAVKQEKSSTVTDSSEIIEVCEDEVVVEKMEEDSKDVKPEEVSSTETADTGPRKNKPSVLPGILRYLGRKYKLPKSGGGLSAYFRGPKKRVTKKSILTNTQKDWKGFKEKEGIVEELKEHNKGKDGYWSWSLYITDTIISTCLKLIDTWIGKTSSSEPM